MSNTFELVRLSTQDHIELCGLMSCGIGGERSAIIHVHGLAGNFYEQSFVDNLVNVAVNTRRRIFLFNNRGHDYFSDAIRKADNQRETIAKGGAHERIADATLDISAAVAYVKQCGIHDIIITSHSTGCVKVVRYFLDSHIPPEITGTVFISPSDDVGLQADNAGGEFQNTLEQAKKMVQQGCDEELMPSGTFFYPIDAQAYLDLFDPHGPGNVFDLTNCGPGLDLLRHVHTPSLVIFGSDDIAVTDSDKKHAADKIIAALPANSRNCAAIINGATHDYAGYEGQLQKVIEKWIIDLTI